jgi:threonine aldolase
MIDLRSDTVTKPTPAMRAAMAGAEVGDDVYSEDPTVNRLQERAADLFGKEAALFVPSGTMGNQIAVKLHTKPGHEIIMEERSHIYNFELGMAAVLSGATVRPLTSADPSGMLTWEEIVPQIRLEESYHDNQTGLICLENTHNFGGGSVMTGAECEEICRKAHNAGLPVHMDGARIFNASAASGETVAELTKDCDSVQFCLSKGLGAPVGSVLLGTKEFIVQARTWRKRLGGGMRQVGILAAAGLVAMEETPGRLHIDHENARVLAEGLAGLPGIAVDVERVATNIVILDVAGTGQGQDEICRKLQEAGILAIGWDTKIRMVTHYDIARADIVKTVDVMNNVVR